MAVHVCLLPDSCSAALAVEERGVKTAKGEMAAVCKHAAANVQHVHNEVYCVPEDSAL